MVYIHSFIPLACVLYIGHTINMCCVFLGAFVEKVVLMYDMPQIL